MRTRFTITNTVETARVLYGDEETAAKKLRAQLAVVRENNNGETEDERRATIKRLEAAISILSSEPK